MNNHHHGDGPTVDKTDAKGAGADQTDARGQSKSGSAHKGHAAPMKESDFLSDCYKMNHKNRGIAVIFNNKKFHPKLGMNERTGTDVDCDNMYKLFTILGFEEIKVLHDCTAKKMKEEMIAVAREDHSQNDCFVSVILSHGEEGVIYGTDDKIAIDELVLPIKGHNCPSLGGKPKIFFIQACRGTELDPGVEVSDASGEEEAMDDEVVMRRIPTEADFLMAYSVVPGYFAWRNSARGSWFIQSVYEVFQEHWEKKDLMTMMTRVNKKVAYDFQSNASKAFMNQKKQIPCITSMLTKDVFFK